MSRPASPTPDPPTVVLLAWLESCGASFPCVSFPCLHPTLGYRCALAKQDIEPYQPIVSIPFECMVCVPNCLRDPQDSLAMILREMWTGQTLGGDGLLALCISREVVKGESSSFHPYLSFLIETADPGTISKWPENERAMLQDEVISRRAEERSVTEVRMHSRIVAGVKKYAQQHHPAAYLDLTEALDRISSDIFVWSYHIIQARAFGRRLPWTSLVPLADCFNHANLPVRYALDTVGDGTVGGARGGTIDPGENSGVFTLFPSGNNCYSRGCEVFNSYGRRDNSHLLLDYGFAIMNNEWETVSIRASLIKGESPKEIAAYELRRSALRDLGYRSVRTVKLQKSVFADDGLLMFRVSNVHPDETGNDLEVNILDLLQPFDKNVEVRALSGLMGLIREVGQGEWTTSVGDDEAELASLNLGKENAEASLRKKTAVEYRLTRKRIVREAVQKLERAFIILTSSGDFDDSENGKDDSDPGDKNDENCGYDEKYLAYLAALRQLVKEG